MREQVLGLIALVLALIWFFHGMLAGIGDITMPKNFWWYALGFVGLIVSGFLGWWAWGKRGSVNKTWIVRSVGLVLGISVFHWLIWSIHPVPWMKWFDSTTFWPMNIAVVFAMFIVSQGAMMVRGLGIGLLFLVAWYLVPQFYTYGIPLDNLPSSAPQVQKYDGKLPADIVLPIIAQCESEGRQFETDGITPLRNREGSSAIGKYQIMSSLHEERARSLGFDIRTLQGNEGYARYLYAESGTQHWEADSLSRNCWEPQLIALAGQTPSRETTFIVTAGSEWSEVYKYPRGKTVDHRAIGPSKRFAMMTESGIYSFTPEKSAVVPGGVPWARFKSLTDSEEKVKVTLY